MKPLNDLPLEKFSVQIRMPEKRTAAACLTVSANGFIQINSRLRSLLNDKPCDIRFTRDGTSLCILQNVASERMISFPKNGRRRLPDVLQLLHENHIPTPAKYSMNFSNAKNGWQGDYEMDPTLSLSKKRRSSGKTK